jgi:hypothetical protein
MPSYKTRREVGEPIKDKKGKPTGGYIVHGEDLNKVIPVRKVEAGRYEGIIDPKDLARGIDYSTTPKHRKYINKTDEALKEAGVEYDK